MGPDSLIYVSLGLYWFCSFKSECRPILWHSQFHEERQYGIWSLSKAPAVTVCYLVGNRTPDLLISCPPPYQLGHRFPHLIRVYPTINSSWEYRCRVWHRISLLRPGINTKTQTLPCYSLTAFSWVCSLLPLYSSFSSLGFTFSFPHFWNHLSFHALLQSPLFCITFSSLYL